MQTGKQIKVERDVEIYVLRNSLTYREIAKRFRISGRAQTRAAPLHATNEQPRVGARG
jgi:hypothetical protein